MPETQNLISEEAISKLQELTSNTDTCMLATDLSTAPLHVCPMRVQETDYEGRIWFFSNLDSTHQKHITKDPRVQLVFGNTSKMEFLTVYGIASISTDRTLIDRLWNPVVESWYDGKDDPGVCLICVQPATSHYWDTESGKLVAMAKILTNAVTGTDLNVGVEGDLNV
ncbi:MAG: pyridoxamine 5'-phosphate oxidase family protein [Luteolibacter sp.]